MKRLIGFPVGFWFEGLADHQLFKLEVGGIAGGVTLPGEGLFGCLNVQLAQQFRVGSGGGVDNGDFREVGGDPHGKLVRDFPGRGRGVFAVHDFSDFDGAVGEAGDEENDLVASEFGAATRRFEELSR